MHAKKAPTRDFPGSVRYKPKQRRDHHLRLDHLGALEPASLEIIGVFVIPPGTKTLTVTPVPSRSFAIIALSASSAALDGP
jgi:hypothetical protein